MWPVFAKAAETLNYLKTNLSAARVALIDRLDATISSRQASWGAVAGTRTNIDTTASRVDVAVSTRASQVSVDALPVLPLGDGEGFVVRATLGNTTVETQVLSITGKGYFLGAFQLWTHTSLLNSNGDFRLRIDGVDVFPLGNFGANGSAVIFGPMRFEQSLYVAHSGITTAGPNLQTAVSYTLD